MDWLADHPGGALLLLLVLWLIGGVVAGEQAVHDQEQIDRQHTIQIEREAP
jgi:hypothetical protein